MANKVISGGEGLKSKLLEIIAKVQSAQSVRVGFLEGATYPDGTPVPLVAAVQEFGAPSRGIPPRPYFRGMVQKDSKGWGATMTKLFLANGYDSKKTLTQMGEVVKGQLQTSIRDLTEPALAPATIAAKGFDKPLIDTGHMLNSVDYDVQEKA